MFVRTPDDPNDGILTCTRAFIRVIDVYASAIGTVIF